MVISSINSDIYIIKRIIPLIVSIIIDKYNNVSILALLDKLKPVSCRFFQLFIRISVHDYKTHSTWCIKIQLEICYQISIENEGSKFVTCSIIVLTSKESHQTAYKEYSLSQLKQGVSFIPNLCIFVMGGLVPSHFLDLWSILSSCFISSLCFLTSSEYNWDLKETVLTTLKAIISTKEQINTATITMKFLILWN